MIPTNENWSKRCALLETINRYEGYRFGVSSGTFPFKESMESEMESDGWFPICVDCIDDDGDVDITFYLKLSDDGKEVWTGNGAKYCAEYCPSLLRQEHVKAILKRIKQMESQLEFLKAKRRGMR